MKKLAIILMFLLIFPAPTLAGSWPQSNTRADSCEGLARACTAAARELLAARKLIAGYEAHIAAADDRIRIAERQIEALKEARTLEAQRAVELVAVIAAEREKITALQEKIALQEKRIAKLEGQAKRWRRFALVAGVAAAVAILVGSRK